MGHYINIMLLLLCYLAFKYTVLILFHDYTHIYILLMFCPLIFTSSVFSFSNSIYLFILLIACVSPIFLRVPLVEGICSIGCHPSDLSHPSKNRTSRPKHEFRLTACQALLSGAGIGDSFSSCLLTLRSSGLLGVGIVLPGSE